MRDLRSMACSLKVSQVGPRRRRSWSGTQAFGVIGTGQRSGVLVLAEARMRAQEFQIQQEHGLTSQTTTDAWPDLNWPDWQDTGDTLHRWTQIVGKVRM